MAFSVSLEGWYKSRVFVETASVVWLPRLFPAVWAVPTWERKLFLLSFAYNRLKQMQCEKKKLLFFCFILQPPQAKVIEVKSKPKSKWRPQPMDTVVGVEPISQCLYISFLIHFVKLVKSDPAVLIVAHCFWHCVKRQVPIFVLVFHCQRFCLCGNAEAFFSLNFIFACLTFTMSSPCFYVRHSTLEKPALLKRGTEKNFACQMSTSLTISIDCSTKPYIICVCVLDNGHRSWRNWHPGNSVWQPRTLCKWRKSSILMASLATHVLKPPSFQLTSTWALSWKPKHRTHVGEVHYCWCCHTTSGPFMLCMQLHS